MLTNWKIRTKKQGRHPARRADFPISLPNQPSYLNKCGITNAFFLCKGIFNRHNPICSKLISLLYTKIINILRPLLCN